MAGVGVIPDDAIYLLSRVSFTYRNNACGCAMSTAFCMLLSFREYNSLNLFERCFVALFPLKSAALTADKSTILDSGKASCEF